MLSNKNEITIIGHYNMFPIDSGGKICTRDFYCALSRWFDINLIVFTDCSFYSDKVILNNHFIVYILELPDEIKEKYKKYRFDSECFLNECHKNEDIKIKVAKIAEKSISVFAEHCYTWNLIKEACKNKHFWYRSHNVESDFVIDWFGITKEQAVSVYKIEKECVNNCEVILTITQKDIERMLELYCDDSSDFDIKNKFINLQAGYVLPGESFQPPSKRKRIDNGFLFNSFFIANNSYSSLEAVKILLEAAVERNDICFYIGGSVCKKVSTMQVPSNVILLGYLKEEQKEYYLSHCDFAINPVINGGGLNIKMLEFFAHGIVTISSIHGSRGLDVEAGKHCIVYDTYLKDGINHFCSMSSDEKDNMAQSAYCLLEERYSWKSLIKPVLNRFKEQYGLKLIEHKIQDEDKVILGYESLLPDIPKGKIYIRGTGDYGMRCLRMLQDNNIQPDYFVDISRFGSTIEGIPVIDMDEYRRDNGDKVIILAMYDYTDVATQLLSEGISNILIALEGQYLLNISTLSGNLPAYFDKKKVVGQIAKRRIS